METVVDIPREVAAPATSVHKEKPPLSSPFSAFPRWTPTEDAKKAIHSVRVGLSLVLVSLFYLVWPAVYDQVGDNAMWAIMTVVVVFEFYAGATLSKGLNRGMGTIIGGGLGCLAALLARKVGEIPRAVLIGSSVFIFGSLATYLRLVPSIKKKYDYGAMIFILTFNLIAVSGVHGEDIIDRTSDRLLTIAIGFAICIFASLFIFPVWASDELHRALISKFDILARSIDECLAEYLRPIDRKTETGTGSKASSCLSVLYSKAKDESLANFARWEPWHGKFGLTYPWDRYLKIAELLRELAASVYTLKAGFLPSHRQLSPPSSRSAIDEACEALGTLLSFSLTELGDSIFSMRKWVGRESVTAKLRSRRLILSLALANSKLITGLENGSSNGLTISFVFLLMDMAEKVELLAKEVEELGDAAGFLPP